MTTLTARPLQSSDLNLATQSLQLQIKDIQDGYRDYPDRADLDAILAVSKALYADSNLSPMIANLYENLTKWSYFYPPTAIVELTQTMIDIALDLD